MFFKKKKETEPKTEQAEVVPKDLLEAELEFQKMISERQSKQVQPVQQQQRSNNIVVEEAEPPQQQEEPESSYNIFCMKCKKKHPHNNVTASEVIIKKVKLNGYCGKCNSSSEMFIGEEIDG